MARRARPAKEKVSKRVSVEQHLREMGYLTADPPEVRWVPTKDTLKNKLERDYWEHLEELRLAGEIIDFRYERIAFILGHDCRFFPDFLVIYPDGRITLHEVKGFMEEDARVKLKTFASLFPYFPLYLVTRERANARWKVERVKPLTR